MMCAPSSIVSTNMQLVENYVKPQVAAPIVVAAPPKSRFTVSHASRASGVAQGAPQLPVYARDDMAMQKAAVELHAHEQQEAFILKHEKASVVTEADRRLSTIMLLNLAAQRDVEAARQAAYPQPVVDFMKQTWAAFIRQAKEFFQADAEEPCTLEMSRTALENISSIGVWFTGPQISLPLRRYTVQVVGADGALQNITAVGLLSFAYSSYVMQLRSMSQQTALENLARMQEQLGTASLFLPELLVASSD